MRSPPRYAWFPARRQLVVRLDQPARHFSLVHAESGAMLGEAPASPSSVYSTVLPAITDKPFTVEVRSGRSRIVHRQKFAPGNSIAPSHESNGSVASSIVWDLAGWQDVKAIGLVWSGEEGVRQVAMEKTSPFRLELPEPIQAAAAEIVLTPFQRDGVQGPSEVIENAGPKAAAILSRKNAGLVTLLNTFWPGQGEPALRRLSEWPAPVAGSLLATLAGVVGRAKKGSGSQFPERICQVFRRPNTYANFLDAYEQNSCLVHLFASKMTLLGLAVLFGMPEKPMERTAAMLVARAYGEGTADTQMLQAMEADEGDEIGFWAAALYEQRGKPGTRRRLADLAWLRLERRCPATTKDADEVAKLLRQLDASPLANLSLDADAPAELRQSAMHAENLQRAAVQKPTPDAIRQAAEAGRQTIHAVHEYRRREGGARARAWIHSVLVERRLLSVDELTTAVPETVDLAGVWQEWVSAREWVDVQELQRAINLDEATVVAPLTSTIERLESPIAQDAPGCEALVEILRAMRGEAGRLALSARQEIFRDAARVRCEQLASGIQSKRAQELAAADLTAARTAVEACDWRTLLDALKRLSDTGLLESECEGAWADLLDAVPASLRQILALPARGPREGGLDEVVEAVRNNLANAAAAARKIQNEQAGLAKRLLQLSKSLRVKPFAMQEEEEDAEEKTPPFYAEEYNQLRDRVIQPLKEARRSERFVRQQGQAMVPELRKHTETYLQTAYAPGVDAPLSAAARSDMRQLRQSIESVLKEGNPELYPDMIARLPEAVRMLAQRRDMLGLDQVPEGARLWTWPLATRWVLRPSDVPLVERLQGLARLPCRVDRLLTDQAELEALQTGLAEVLEASHGQTRRWWAVLYREVAEVLRGKMASLPSALPPWGAPRAEKRPEMENALLLGELDRAMDFLEHIQEVLNRTDAGRPTVPEGMRRALVENELVAG